jgi:hypothetical protein
VADVREGDTGQVFEGLRAQVVAADHVAREVVARAFADPSVGLVVAPAPCAERRAQIVEAERLDVGLVVLEEDRSRHPDRSQVVSERCGQPLAVMANVFVCHERALGASSVLKPRLHEIGLSS